MNKNKNNSEIGNDGSIIIKKGKHLKYLFDSIRKLIVFVLLNTRIYCRTMSNFVKRKKPSYRQQTI